MWKQKRDAEDIPNRFAYVLLSYHRVEGRKSPRHGGSTTMIHGEIAGPCKVFILLEISVLQPAETFHLLRIRKRAKYLDGLTPPILHIRA
jgi:hypothetical protein